MGEKKEIGDQIGTKPGEIGKVDAVVEDDIQKGHQFAEKQNAVEDQQAGKKRRQYFGAEIGV